MNKNLEEFKIIHLPASFPKACTDAMEVVGTSMQPTIMDGAVVGVDFNDTEFEHNQIFALRLRSGELMIKRLLESPQGILASSDNSLMFRSFIIKEDQIIARVKWSFNDYDAQPSQ